MNVDCSPQVKRQRLSACTSSKYDIDSYSTIQQEQAMNSRFDDVSNDELTGVFLKLPVKLVHRLKCVSKRWFSFISDPGFARSYAIMHSRITTSQDHDNDPTGTNNHLLILYNYRETCGDVGGGVNVVWPLHNDMNTTSSPSDDPPMLSFRLDFIARTKQYPCPPPSSSVGGIGEQCETVFLEEVQFKGVCNELLLAQAIYRDAIYRNSTRNYQWHRPKYSVFYVCNPITKHWVELPIVPVEGHAGFACYQQLQDCEEDPVKKKLSRIWIDYFNKTNFVDYYNLYKKIEFTVVVVSKDERDANKVACNDFTIHVFHSGVAKWSIFRVPFPTSYSWPADFHPQLRRVMFANGLFYWHGTNCIVAYDPFNAPHHCDIIPLPSWNNERLTFRCLGGLFFAATHKGFISVGTKFLHKGRYVVWELVDHAKKIWKVRYDVKVRDIALPHSFVFESFAGDDGDSVYSSSMNLPMLFDIRNNSFHYVYNSPSDSDETDDECDDEADNKCKYILHNVESFVWNSWPMPVPVLRQY